MRLSWPPSPPTSAHTCSDPLKVVSSPPHPGPLLVQEPLFFPEVPATWIHILVKLLISFLYHLFKMSLEAPPFLDHRSRSFRPSLSSVAHTDLSSLTLDSTLREKMKTSSCLERFTVSPAGPSVEELRYRERKMLGHKTVLTSNSPGLYCACSDLQKGLGLEVGT